MNDKTKELINGLGAIGEMCGVLRESLVASGFTRKEAVQLVGEFLVATLEQSHNNGQKK